MEEIWKDCVNWEGLYQVSNLGRVKSIGVGPGRKKGGRILSCKSRSTKGYPQLCLHLDGRAHVKKMHNLVTLAFIGPKNGLTVDHIDGNKENNNLSNLEYVTNAENMRRAKLLGLTAKPFSLGTKPKGKKITYLGAKQIRQLVQLGFVRREIASVFGIHKATVGEIVRGEIWKESMHG